MKTFLCILAGLGFLTNCAASQKTVLPRFSYNHRLHNAWIVGRRPHYGDGQPDGCLVGQEFDLQLVSTAGDSISGFVKQVDSTEPVLFAQISMLPLHSAAPIALHTNPTGHFSFSRSQEIRRITIASIGYRTLTVNLGSKARK